MVILIPILELTNVNVTRNPALMMDIVAWSMEASAMRPDPLRTIMTPDTCATSQNSHLISKTCSKLCFRVKNCTCWSRKVTNDDCPQDEACAKKYNEGICSIEMPGRDYKMTSYKCPNGFKINIDELS